MRSPRTFAVTLGLAGLAPCATAQLSTTWSLEYFNWNEGPGYVLERGLLAGFTVGFMEPETDGVVLALRGKLYGGAAAYEGGSLIYQSTAVSSAIGYLGIDAEGQMRIQAGGKVELVPAFGGAVWRRQMGRKQGEDYRLVFVAFGVDYNARWPGWMIGARLNYPVWTQLDPHMRSLGYDSNPILTLGQAVGGSCQFGYRFPRRWALIGYYNLFRFTGSNMASVTGTNLPPLEFNQPPTDTYVLGVKAEFTH